VHRHHGSISVAAIAVIAGVTSGASAGVIYDAGANFNGTQGGTTGVWQYGRFDPSTNAFSQVTYNGPYFGSDVSIGASHMHPGGYFTGVRAVLRFVAPESGTYTATFRAKLADAGNNPYIANYDYRRDGVRMWVNTASYDLQTWDQASSAQSFVYQTVTQTFTLAAGGVIDFAIDPNGARGFDYGAQPSYLGYNIYDSTSYTATVEVLPTPGSAAMLLVAGVVATRRRR